MRCLLGERSRLSRWGREMLGLRLNNEDKSGMVPPFGEVDMASGCSLGVLAAARTAVGRPFVAPPGKAGPERTTSEGRPDLCSCFFASFDSLMVLVSERGRALVCCFLFSRSSPWGAALHKGGSGDDCWCLIGKW